MSPVTTLFMFTLSTVYSFKSYFNKEDSKIMVPYIEVHAELLAINN